MGINKQSTPGKKNEQIGEADDEKPATVRQLQILPTKCISFQVQSISVRISLWLMFSCLLLSFFSSPVDVNDFSQLR